MSEKSIDYSIVIPVHNEEESIRELFAELLHVMTPLNRPYEIIFVDDGSTDASPSLLDGFHDEFPEAVHVIHLPERRGQTYGMRTGLDAAKGKIDVTLDADLQNDPADIPRLFEKMNEGDYDCVCGWRKARQDTLLKAGMSKFGNVVQRLFTGMKVHDVSCTLRAYKLGCVGKIALNWEGQHRFIPLSLSLQGYCIGEIVSHHRLRKFGKTKYSHKRVFRVVLDFFKMLKTGGKA